MSSDKEFSPVKKTSLLKLWEVIINVPIRDAFTYSCEDDLNLMPGTSVMVPLGPKNRQVKGLIIGENENENFDEFKIKSISNINSERPILTQSMLSWLKWIADYYVYPLGQIQELVFPSLKKEGRKKSRKSPLVPDLKYIEPPPLTKDQENVLKQIEINKFNTYLLHGVTGSGKTEVYIETIERVLKENKTALVLVPEISLTPQLIRRFAERFSNEIAVLHSHLTEREKTEQWWSIVDGQKRVLIGARSALFCPIPNLGLIVIDEEHETSFKQEEKLKYNARDIAIVKARYENCPIILGSATPSLETWQNAQSGKYKLLSIHNRVSDRPLPKVLIVNPQQNRDPHNSLPYWLSLNLYEKLVTNYEKGHQAALFLNRRGVAPSVQCYSCGYTSMCPNCDISLTLHGQNHLVCHYCNYHEQLALQCPQCHEGDLKAYGLGTEAVEVELRRLFPEAVIFRADRDEIANRNDLEDMIQKMENNEIQFLIGTQMIAKGLDFKNLTLVGIIHADVAFNVPDFRASERSFQLCTQVSGRAGRHKEKGEVIIQTYKTTHPSLLAAQHHDYLQFAEHELKNRQLFSYPPYGKLASIRFSGLRESEVIEEAHNLTEYLIQLCSHFETLRSSQILGPTPAPLSRIKNRYRYHILIKSPEHQALNHICNKAYEFIKNNIKKSKSTIDVDPYSLL
jgi:primosomal protein N' (replication factor Y) (superfamily II helicase)